MPTLLPVDDVLARIDTALRELSAQAERETDDVEYARLHAKIDGVKLVRSYLDDALREQGTSLDVIRATRGAGARSFRQGTAHD